MSGFSYRSWTPVFYPQGTKPSAMLTYFATRFNVVELNMTFRRNVPSTTVEKWRGAVPDDFRFSAKAHQRITHYRRLVGTADAVREFVDSMRALDTTLGVILFQTRSNLKFDPEVLASFCTELPPGYSYALEPRHESFASDECREILRKHSMSLCINDDVFDPLSYRATGPLAYFRFHRKKPYEREELDERAQVVREQGADVYVIFKHEDDPNSVRIALDFQELVT